MAQNITLMGASFSDVPSILLPKTGGGQASFVDIADTTAAASDVASGKYFYTAAGVKTQGTASGGGGSAWTLLATATLTVNTTSTSAASAGTVSCGTAAFTADKLIYVRIRDKAGKRAGYFYGSDTLFWGFTKANNTTTTNTYAARSGYGYNSSSQWLSASTSYGVYGYSIDSTGKLTVRRRYNSSYGTINGNFLVQVYSIDFPDGKAPGSVIT